MTTTACRMMRRNLDQPPHAEMGTAEKVGSKKMGRKNRTPHQKLKAMIDRFSFIAEKASSGGPVFVLEGEATIWAVELMMAAIGETDQGLALKMQDATALWRTVVESDEDHAKSRPMRRLIGRERAQRNRFAPVADR